MLGLLTIILFGVFGGGLWMEGQTQLGGIILLLAALRSVLWIRMQIELMRPYEEDDEAEG